MIDLRKIDVRVVQRYIAKGKLTREAYEAHLAALPDVGDNADAVNLDRLLAQEESVPALPRSVPGAGTPIQSGGSAAGPLPPLPVSRG